MLIKLYRWNGELARSQDFAPGTNPQTAVIAVWRRYLGDVNGQLPTPTVSPIGDGTLRITDYTAEIA
jgi:hypothetical protein